MTEWTAGNIPSQVGRTVVITGTGGLGYEDALALARAGADVILAGRNPEKGAESIGRIRAVLPHAHIRFELLDLASLQSIHTFSDRLHQQNARIDILINNAGVMVPPQRQETSNGFELQLGTNYLGHFALTGLLLPLLCRGQAPRVVTLSSVAARSGVINFDDLNADDHYQPMTVYAQSKLACLMFAFELQRLSIKHGWGVTGIAAHPGISRTDLLHNAPGRWSFHGMIRTFFWFLFQPASQGALSTLFAATSPAAKPGGYYGPDKLSETRGFPADAKSPVAALDEAVAARLWHISEELTGVRYGDGGINPLGI